MPTLIRVKLLGEFALRIGNGSPVALPLKSRALLAFLALQAGHPVNREVVSELLWPERDEKHSRNSLKQELYVLRRDGFGGQDAIWSRNNAIGLHPDSINCDVLALRGMILPRADARWQSILELYSGALLQGFAGVSPAFDDWLTGMRRALEADVLDALGAAADASMERQDHPECIAVASRMLAIDPLREDVHRRLIMSYARIGRRAEAMRIYNDAKTLLRREMNVAPSIETEALIVQIQGNRLQGTHPTGTHPTGAHPQGDRTQDAQAWGAQTPAMRAETSVTRLAPPTVAPVLSTGPPRIAVLPLQQMHEQAVPSHISDGITADIIAQLSGLHELSVISHGSTYGLRDPTTPPWDIGRKLNARYLVMGRIRRGGDRLRLTTELTEAETGQVVQGYTDDASDSISFEEQDRIVGRLVNRLLPHVREAELRRIRGKRPSVLNVYEKILLSREYIMLLDRPRFGQAKDLLDEVITEDPGYGEAHALAAEWHSTMAGEGWSADRAAEVAAVERLNRTALSLDSSNLRALISHGYRRSLHHRDHDGAKQAFHKALDVAPCSATAWALSGLCFAWSGDGKEAVRRSLRALELSPDDREKGKFFHALCFAHYTTNNYQEAADWGLRALASKNLWRGAMVVTAASLAAQGRLHEAHDVTTMWQKGSPGRGISAILRDHQYTDPERRQRYGEHLRAAGFPE